MDPVLGGAVISGLGGLVGNLLTGSAQKDTNKTNLQIARETNEANYRLWNENNLYNTPAAQMSRLRAAGLNPNMVYGQVSSGNSSSPVTAQGAVMKSAKFGDFGASAAVMSYLQGKMQESTISLQDTQSAKNKAETNRTNVESLNLQKDGLLKDITYSQKLFDYFKSNDLYPVERRQLELSLKQKKREIARIDATIDNLNAQTSRTEVETELMPKQFEIAEFNAQTARISALSNSERNRVLNDLTSTQNEIAIRELPFVTEKNFYAVKQAYESCLYTIANTEKVEAEALYDKVKATFADDYGLSLGQSELSQILGLVASSLRRALDKSNH